MLFEEPTSALDPESSAEVLTVMRELSTEASRCSYRPTRSASRGAATEQAR
jgi:ABC-type transporter Mla maintaining outer membrane lipid asymmetry ATPase subunit MlaF